jgi:crotonobetainyl-CoA:carnitine CoA-transferase CaiB-like acyl-CoA transferase
MTQPIPAGRRGRAFDGIRVVELAQYVFVPGAGAMLADEGAEVIKVEMVDSGDPYRTLSIGDGRELAEVNIALEQNNRGKKSIAINLKTAEGRALFASVIQSADVFLTSLRPEALRRLQMEPDDLKKWNPRLIYARANGFGFNGAEANKPGYDYTAFWTRAGFATALMHMDHSCPVRPRGALGDHVGSISIAYGVAAALLKRERTGESSLVESSLLATGMWTLSADITAAQIANYDSHLLERRAPRHPLMQPFKTADGRWIQFAFLHPDRYWAELCQTLELDEIIADARFSTRQERAKNGIECTELISQAISAKPWSYWKHRFGRFDAPWELAQTIDELLVDPQAVENGYIAPAVMTDGREYKLVSSPVSFDSDVRSRFDRAPKLGEHTNEILEGLGMSADKIKELRKSEIIR